MKCCNEKMSKNTEQISSSLDGLICYCFKHSKKELFEAIQEGREQGIIKDIAAKIKDLGCYCETANPSGKCCLVDVSSFIKIVHKSKLL